MQAKNANSHAEGNEQLRVLEELLALEALDPAQALADASDLVACALQAEKVDVLLYDPAIDSLVAQGTSRTPMGARQHALGLDRQQVSNGGRAVRAYQTGEPDLTGHADQEQNELPGMVHGLGIRSEIITPIEVGAERRGVLLASSSGRDYFSRGDLSFLAAAARWIGMVLHRMELAARLEAEALERGRRVAAEELMRSLAHDLRGHLAPAKAHLGLLIRRLQREGKAPLVASAQEAVNSIDRMHRLIDELLDAARLDAGLFSLQEDWADLHQAVEDACAVLGPDRERLRLSTADVALRVWADGPRIRQIVENLLTNAVQHSPPGSPIEVAVCVEEDGGQRWARVEVANQGAGIPRDLLPHLFRRFSRGPGSMGLGLGLYIARGVANAHGGSLEAASEPGQGARFTLTLPLP